MSSELKYLTVHPIISAWHAPSFCTARQGNLTHIPNPLEPTCLDTLEHACLHTFEKTCQAHPQRVPQRGARGRRPRAPLCGGGLRLPPFVNGSGKFVQTCRGTRVPTYRGTLAPTRWGGVRNLSDVELANRGRTNSDWRCILRTSHDFG